MKQGRVDPTKKINLDTNTRYDVFKSHLWTYPYVRARLFDIAGALLEKTKRPEITTKEGYNLIHLAFVIPGAYQIDLELTDERKVFVEAAVKKGVDPGAKLANGDTLQQVAEKNGAIDTAKYLASLES